MRDYSTSQKRQCHSSCKYKAHRVTHNHHILSGSNHSSPLGLPHDSLLVLTLTWCITGSNLPDTRVAGFSALPQVIEAEDLRISQKPRSIHLLFTMASSSSNVVGVHYRVGKKIGEGSFGVIFEGTNLLNNQQVAIKFVRLFPFLREQQWHIFNTR